MTINERIAIIIKELGLNNNSFSKIIGVNPTIIHNIIKGRNKPSFDLMQKIISSFDNINIDYLLKGEGSPINSNIVNEPYVKYGKDYSNEIRILKERIKDLENLLQAKQEIIQLLKDKLDNYEKSNNH